VGREAVDSRSDPKGCIVRCVHWSHQDNGPMQGIGLLLSLPVTSLVLTPIDKIKADGSNVVSNIDRCSPLRWYEFAPSRFRSASFSAVSHRNYGLTRCRKAARIGLDRAGFASRVIFQVISCWPKRRIWRHDVRDDQQGPISLGCRREKDSGSTHVLGFRLRAF